MPILSKPYVITDAARQSEDIDRMFDDVYTEMAELEREQATTDGGSAGGSQRGVPGEDGNDSDAGLWALPVTRSSTSLVDTTNLARLNAIQSFTAANTWTTTGNNFDEVLAVDKGLQFPAAQVANSGVNVLDDYEEGTWTPFIAGSGGTSGQTYTRQNGLYVKIGQLVFVSYDALLSAKGTITGDVQVNGLPFVTHATVTNSSNSLRYITLATTWSTILMLTTASTDVIPLRGQTVASISISTALTTADIENTTNFLGSLVYRADT